MPNHSSLSQHSRGFTLIETMVALAILAITVSIATPSFRYFTANQSLRTASFNLTTDLMLARSEAVKRNGSVVVAPFFGGWQEGWLVAHVGSGTLLASARPLQGKVTTDGTMPAWLAFDSSGRVTAAGGNVQFGLKVDTGGSTQYRCIQLDPTGLPRVLNEACP